MYHHTLISFFILLFLLTSCHKAPEELLFHKKEAEIAIVQTNVCDLLSQPVQGERGKERYQKLPCSYVASKDKQALPRLHQLLFNQSVIVKKISGHEALVELPSLYLKPTMHGKKTALNGWVLKKNLLFIKELSKENLAAIPNPYPPSLQKKPNTSAALLFPLYLPSLNQTFSAATRFVIKEKVSDGFICSLFNPDKKELCDIHLPASAVAKSGGTIDSKINRYIGLLRQWSRLQKGCIPYVFGGASFISPYPDHFMQKKRKINQQFFHVYDRPKQRPFHSGMDCTTLIYLAANIFDLPYDLKNTTAIKHSLPEITKQDRLERGDIIYLPGHVMVISELKPLQVIQSMGYSSGLGRVVEHKGEELFASITTAEELLASYWKKKALRYKRGQNYPSWKIYRFRKYLLQQAAQQKIGR